MITVEEKNKRAKSTAYGEWVKFEGQIKKVDKSVPGLYYLPYQNYAFRQFLLTVHALITLIILSFSAKTLKAYYKLMK